ncbi:MAG: GtrA family protein [Maricaulaceae bacterium]
MKQISRYLTAGTAVIIFYVSGVWIATDILGLPPRPVNISLYVTATFISFALAYKWVFAATGNPKRALILFCALQLGGIGFNALWVEAGLRFTKIYPWIIAASFFAVWPFISYRIQRQYIFQ